MSLRLDFKHDMLITPHERIPLQTFRKFLATRYRQLVMAHYVGSSVVDGATHFTFDWLNIFTVAEKTGVPLQEFLLTRK